MDIEEHVHPSGRGSSAKAHLLTPPLLQVALDYSAILLQLRQSRWSAPDGGGVPNDGVTTAEETSAEPLLSALAEQSRFINMLEEDEDWLPVTLEFFLQVEDPELRLKFLRAAEAQSLLLGLLGDASLKATRWNEATRALLARPLDPQVTKNLEGF